MMIHMVKLWKIERIPTNMTSQAVLLFIFVDRIRIQSIQNDVMYVEIRSFFHNLHMVMADAFGHILVVVQLISFLVYLQIS